MLPKWPGDQNAKAQDELQITAAERLWEDACIAQK
jgi:hypothetical protein